MRLDSFPRHPLTFGPSPVHPLDRLTEHLGGVQSNHTRQVAAAAARTGLGCVLVQESWVDWPDVVYDRVGNIQLSRIMGADVRLVQSDFGIGFKASWAQEVAEQERELGVFFDTIVVCSVTGSTHAGMVAGFAAQDRERRVIGIDASAKPAETRDQVARIARATAELIEVGRELRDDEIVLDERYHAGTYGIPDERTLEAIRTAGRLEGMITDPVYEGKSMAGMIDLVARGGIDRDATVLYAHLGGQPALNAYAAL